MKELGPEEWLCVQAWASGSSLRRALSIILTGMEELARGGRRDGMGKRAPYVQCCRRVCEEGAGEEGVLGTSAGLGGTCTPRWGLGSCPEGRGGLSEDSELDENSSFRPRLVLRASHMPSCATLTPVLAG